MNFCYAMQRAHRNETVICKTAVILTLDISSFVTQCISLDQFREKINMVSSHVYFGTWRRLNSHLIKIWLCDQLEMKLVAGLVPPLPPPSKPALNCNTASKKNVSLPRWLIQDTFPRHSTLHLVYSKHRPFQWLRVNRKPMTWEAANCTTSDWNV